ncbi:hypothetical protein JCM18902_2654 [Psychrobacter sp. JCM 18902]|nr:hypothetical protein JCM18902_2654 [Psychrobacter sp. JCM 18902]
MLTRASNWTDRAATAEQLRRALGSDTAKSLLVEDMSQVMLDFVAAHNDGNIGGDTGASIDKGSSVDNGANIFKPSYVQLACEYLVSVMGQSAETSAGANSTVNWQTSQQAQQLCEQLSQTLNSASGSIQATASFDQLQSSISKLGFQLKSAYELLATWFHALLEKTYGGNESANVATDGTNEAGEALSEAQLSEIEEQNTLRKQQLESGRHYVPEAIAVLLTQLNDAQREALVQRLIDSGASFNKGAFNKGLSAKGLGNQGLNSTGASARHLPYHFPQLPRRLRHRLH